MPPWLGKPYGHEATMSFAMLLTSFADMFLPGGIGVLRIVQCMSVRATHRFAVFYQSSCPSRFERACLGSCAAAQAGHTIVG